MAASSLFLLQNTILSNNDGSYGLKRESKLHSCELHRPGEYLVPGICANKLYSAHRSDNNGTLFRLDLGIGNATGETQRETAYVWLCSSCARKLRPKVSTAGGRILVCLASIRHSSGARMHAPTGVMEI